MKTVQKLKSGLGYSWAVLCLVAILATFLGLGFWERTLARETGIHVSPRFTGGEVRHTIDHGLYRTVLHRLVFDGLVSDRSEGFVQIDWMPRENQPLPTVIMEDLDIDGDASVDLTVRVDTIAGTAQLMRKEAWVLDPETLISAGSERILRVRLRNPRK
jgi:hypothetical protein